MGLGKGHAHAQSFIGPHRRSVQYDHNFAIAATKCSPAFAAPESLTVGRPTSNTDEDSGDDGGEEGGGKGGKKADANAACTFNGAKADVWSVGITLYVFIFGRTPYSATTHFGVFAQISDPDFIEFTAPLSSELRGKAKRIISLFERAQSMQFSGGVGVGGVGKQQSPTITFVPGTEEDGSDDDGNGGGRSPLIGIAFESAGAGGGAGGGPLGGAVASATNAAQLLASISAFAADVGGLFGGGLGDMDGDWGAASVEEAMGASFEDVGSLEDALVAMRQTCALQAAVYALKLPTEASRRAEARGPQQQQQQKRQKEDEEIASSLSSGQSPRPQQQPQPEEADFEACGLLSASDLATLGFVPSHGLVRKYAAALSLLSLLLERDPTRRVSARRALEHRFFRCSTFQKLRGLMRGAAGGGSPPSASDGLVSPQ